MTTHRSFANLMLRVWIAFFAAVCILASVNAYADDTVDLYYVDLEGNETFKTSGNDVGVVLNPVQIGNTLKITGSATHSKMATIRNYGLSIYGIDKKRQINVQSSDTNVPVYAFAKTLDSLEFKMKDIEYCGNSENVRSVFIKDEYTGPSSNSMGVYCYNVSISSFVDPDSEVCLFNIVNPSEGHSSGITFLGRLDSYSNTFSNNKGCIRASSINFNPADNANGPTGDWNFNNNFANNGSALYGYEIYLKDPGIYTFKGNSAVENGGAIFCTKNYDGAENETQESMCYLLNKALTLNFEDNVAGKKGGAIYGCESEIHLCGDVTIKNNRAGISLDGNNVASGKGGAICCETSLNSRFYPSYKMGYVYINRSASKFESNLASGDGGAIYSEGRVDIYENTSVKFLNNVAGFVFTDESTGDYSYKASGGAIYSMEYIMIEESPSEFSENSATNSGGAIYCESFVHILESPSEFSKNSAANSGGAIYITDTDNYIYIRNSLSEFSENSAANSGGTIYCEGRVYFNNSPLTVSENKASKGGAIYSPYVEFYGADGSATFTGNYGNFNNVGEINYACGNDVYCPVNDHYSPSDGDVATSLGFSDAGAYSFDGGIYIEYTERNLYDDDPYNTVINESQVTIAGRANDNTNYYQLRRANIFKGGKLTAKLDEIEGINGIFVMDDNSAKLELNVTGAADPKKLTMTAQNVNGSAQDNDLAVQGSGVIEKTGDGTLQILAEAEGLVCAESFVVSSGRLDYRGYFTGAVQVGGSEDDAIFSPGNSVGDANVKGNVSILNSGAALFEFGEFPGVDSDSNHDVLYITNGDFSAGNQMISLYFEQADADDWSYEGCKYLLVSGANLPGGDYTSWLDGNYTGLFSLVSESNNLYLVYPLPEPIPEPSTIALLILGAAGLMYVRKRTRK